MEFGFIVDKLCKRKSSKPVKVFAYNLKMYTLVVNRNVINQDFVFDVIYFPFNCEPQRFVNLQILLNLRKTLLHLPTHERGPMPKAREELDKSFV